MPHTGDFTPNEIKSVIEVLVGAAGSAGGSVRGADFSFDGSILSIGSHSTIGFEGEAMDKWSSHPLQVKNVTSEINQTNNERILLDLSQFAGDTVYVLARPTERGALDSSQPAEVEIITDLGDRPVDGSTKLSVILGSVDVDAAGNIISVDISIRENRIDSIQEIIDTLNTTGTLDHSLLSNLNNVADHPGYLDLAGTRPMQGDLDLDGNKINNIAAPSAPGDVATKDYVDSTEVGVSDHGDLTGLDDASDHPAFITVSGSRPFQADQSMGAFSLKDLAAPVDLNDATRKDYVDTGLAGKSDTGHGHDPADISPQGTGSGLDADTVDGNEASALLDRTNHTGTQGPTTISPQGTGSGLDADTVDGNEASALLDRTNHTGTQGPTTISPQGSGSGLDADTVDGQDATAFASASHKDNHLSGGPDAFTSTDLIEAIVKRLRESGGPTDLLLGAVADGEFLKRSGTNIVGDTPAGGGGTTESTSFGDYSGATKVGVAPTLDPLAEMSGVATINTDPSSALIESDTTGFFPAGRAIAFAPDGFLYAVFKDTSIPESKIHKIDPRSGAVVSTISGFSGDVRQILWSQDDGVMYMLFRDTTATQDMRITSIDISTFTLGTPTAAIADAYEGGYILCPTNNKLYGPGAPGTTKSNQTVVIVPSTGSFTTITNDSDNPMAYAYSPANDRIYVLIDDAGFGNTVDVIDPSSDTIVTNISTSLTSTNGSNGFGVYSAHGKKVYLLPSGTSGKITEIDVDSDTETGFTDSIGSINGESTGTCQGLCYTPLNRRVVYSTGRFMNIWDGDDLDSRAHVRLDMATDSGLSNGKQLVVSPWDNRVYCIAQSFSTLDWFLSYMVI